MKVAVFWSGGLDSTYLVYKNLLEGNEVHAYYVRIENNDNKIEEELKAIELLKPLFLEEFPDLFKYQFCISTTNVWLNNDNLIFKQIPSFIYASLWIDYGLDELQLGYCMNDDAVSYLSDIKSIYDSYSVIRHGNSPELTFPLIKYKKEDEYNALPEKYRKYIWYCENPIKHKPCNECASCKRFNSTFPDHNKVIESNLNDYNDTKKKTTKRKK